MSSLGSQGKSLGGTEGGLSGKVEQGSAERLGQPLCARMTTPVVIARRSAPSKAAGWAWRGSHSPQGP